MKIAVRVVKCAPLCDYDDRRVADNHAQCPPFPAHVSAKTFAHTRVHLEPLFCFVLLASAVKNIVRILETLLPSSET